MRVRIRLDTGRDAQKFVAIATSLKGAIHITDGAGLKVSARSLLGALYALEFDELWCESDEDIYHAIEDFIVID
jgi:hypothetical protein